MNILFPTWKSFGVEDIKETFEELGHKVSLYEREPKNYRIDPRYKSEIKKYINLIYFNSTPISPTAVTALLFISVTGSNLK